MRYDIDGAIKTFGRVLGWGYCKGEGMVVSYVGLCEEGVLMENGSLI